MALDGIQLRFRGISVLLWNVGGWYAGGLLGGLARACVRENAWVSDAVHA